MKLKLPWIPVASLATIASLFLTTTVAHPADEPATRGLPKKTTERRRKGASDIDTALTTTRDPASASPAPHGEARIKAFAARQEAVGRRLLEAAGATPGKEFNRFFAAAAAGRWDDMAEAYGSLPRNTASLEHDSGARSAMLEVLGFWEVNRDLGAFSDEFARDILAVMPPGSVYCGGTDQGRFTVSGNVDDFAAGKPVTVLTQNALADGGYLKYLRELFGSQIEGFTSKNSSAAFEGYMADATRRLKSNELLPGEMVTESDNGRIQVSGQVAVMEINGRILRAVFEANPAREFFVEESFPLRWMYPHLEPAGPILKVNHRELPGLPAETLAADRAWWTRKVTPWLGTWLVPGIKPSEFVAGVTRLHGRTGGGGAGARPAFFANPLAPKAWSKLRAATGGLYAWRAEKATDPAEQQRYRVEAEVAFQQAYALCPTSPEAVFRLCDFLVKAGRRSDAQALAALSADLAPRNSEFQRLAGELESPADPATGK